MRTTSQNTKTSKASELQSRPEQLSTGNREQISFAKRRANRALKTEKLLSLLQSETPKFFEKAEVIGQWVWIRFGSKQPASITCQLSELGFHWNNARQSWQHPCGTIKREGAIYDPRKRYGSYFAAAGKDA